MTRKFCSDGSLSSYTPRFAFLSAFPNGAVSLGRSSSCRPKTAMVSHRRIAGNIAGSSLDSSFCGTRLKLTCRFVRNNRVTMPRRSSTKMLVDPWSVSSEALDALAAQFFAASLFPYLGFLYFLNREEVKCPKLANFGFRFLLVFVFATIPAGIYAKVHYHDILANIDWLHGGAESLLTVTNFLIVLGFRDAMMSPEADVDKTLPSKNQETTATLQSMALPTLLMAMGSILPFAALGVFHAEPSNALSFPTWVIHVSSLVEWLVAMGLVWKYAEVSKNPKWKGLTWGMLPLHTSGICACTYHFFYNAPSLNSLVVLQAALTCFGNVTMALATYRIWQSGTKSLSIAGQTPSQDGEAGDVTLVGFEDMAVQFEKDSNPSFFYKVLGLSCAGSAAVKWGSLAFDVPFEHSLLVALGIIFIPTALNMSKWAIRSRSGSSDFGGLL